MMEEERADAATSAWDVETDPANPKPNIWPECPTCETAYVYRRGLSMSQGWVWLWARGCKHKSWAVLMTDHGPYVPSSGRYCVSADDCEADHHLYACPNYTNERDDDA